MFVNFTQTVISVPCRLRNALDGEWIGFPVLYITFKPFKFVLTVNYLDRGQGRLLASTCFGRLRRTEQMIVQPVWPITTKIFLAEKNIFLVEKNIFLAEKKIFLAEKNISCGEKYFLRRKIFLAEKNISCGKIYFLQRKIYFLRKKYISCGEKYISCGEFFFFLRKKYISCGEKYISCGEKYFLRKNIFCTMLPISFRTFASGTLPQGDSSSGSFLQYCQMLYLTATAAPLVFSFLLLE